MAEGADGPVLRVVRGDATPEEVAALVAVVSAANARATASAGEPAAPRVSAWRDPARRVRGPLPHGPGAWRASAFPH